MILEPLERALFAKRNIAGVIRSIGISSDGRGRSLWAPRLEGQVAAIRRAWTENLHPSTLQYIEAHATSTQVGDLTEVRALAAAFDGAIPPGARIPIASVKANLGHCKEAAGLTSLIKVLLSIRHGVIPPAAGFEASQPGLDWSQLPFYPPDAPTPWTGLRRAAIDSFGVGGLNAHLIVDGWVDGSFEASAAAPAPSTAEIAVAGRGCVLPGAFDVTAFENLLRSGQSQTGPVPADRWDASVYFDDSAFHSWRSPVATGGFLRNYRYDWRRHKIPPVQIEFADPLQFMVLDAADQALREAGLDSGQLDPHRTAVVVGTMFGSEFAQQLTRCLQLPHFERELFAECGAAGVCPQVSAALVESFREKFHRDIPALQDETGSFSASTLASRVARTFDLMGGAAAVEETFSGSIAALRTAMNLLRTGRCDAVVCIAADRQLGVSTFEHLSALGVRRPLAEGAVAVVLRRKADLRGRRHYGILRGDFQTVLENSAHPPALASDTIAHQFGDLLSAAGMASLLQASLQSGGPIRRATGSVAVGELIQESGVLPAARIAMLFAGQGSQYTGMLRGIVDAYPAARVALGELDAALIEASLPTFEQLAWSEAVSLGGDILRTQLAVLGADYILYRTVHASGLRPDLVAGHSYGEYAALVAAEVITLAQAIRITRERSALMETHPETAGFLMALGASPEAILRLRQESQAAIHLAILNSPGQTVIGGTAAELDRFAAVAERHKILTHRLSVPRPYHTPLMQPIQAQFRALLETEEFHPPKIPFLSSLTARYLAEPAEIRDHLATQMASTIHYSKMLDRIAATPGSLKLVEIGPRQVLTRIHRSWQSERIELFATDDPKSPRAALERVLALAPRPSVTTTDARPTLGPEVLHFDATARRRAANLASASARSAVRSEAAAQPSDDAAEFLIQFVCEQTGYSRDIVDLDADLEKDLGIDSIRKARMLGALRDRNLLPLAAGATLEDFPTLRSILAQSHHEPAPAPPTQRSASALTHRRYVLRVIEAARPTDNNFAWQTAATVLGGGPLATQLRRALAKRGVRCDVSIDQAPQHLFLTHPRGAHSADPRTIEELYALCRAWILNLHRRGQLSRASLTAVVSLGGDFGFTGEIPNALGGAFTGFFKSLRHEFPALRIKVIDGPPGERNLAEQICEEIESSGRPELEVSFINGTRHRVRALAEPPAMGHAALPQPGDTWIVTGGARGITALAARELASRFHLRLHLIGLTPLDSAGDSAKQSEIRNNLSEFARCGIDATYHVCDVADRAAISATLDAIRAAAPIRGILHGAGYESAASLANKPADSLLRTLAPKITGAQNLIELTKSDGLTHFIAFGSVSGRFGVPGQTDYSLASDLLCKLVTAHRRRTSLAGAVTFHWPAWDGAGMSMRPETKLAIDFAGQAFLAHSEGVAHLLAEIEAGCPEPEVLIAVPSSLDRDSILMESLVFDRLRCSEGCAEAGLDLDESRHDFFRDHRWQSAALLPASAAAAMLLEAATAATPNSPPRVLRDFAVVHPVRSGSGPIVLRVEASLEEKGVACRLTTEFANRSGVVVDAHRLIAEAWAARCSTGGFFLDPLPELDFHPTPYREPAACDAEKLVYYGPSMRCLVARAASGSVGAARIVAPVSAGWCVSPALLDACFVACGVYCYHSLRAVTLVRGFDELRIGVTPASGDECLLHFQWRGESDRIHSFDWLLTGPAGEMLLEAQGCGMIEIGAAA